MKMLSVAREDFGTRCVWAAGGRVAVTYLRRWRG
jgi:hypothetical protein